jgi:hypothetical protein
VGHDQGRATALIRRLAFDTVRPAGPLLLHAGGAGRPVLDPLDTLKRLLADAKQDWHPQVGPPVHVSRIHAPRVRATRLRCTWAHLRLLSGRMPACCSGHGTSPLAHLPASWSRAGPTPLAP